MALFWKDKNDTNKIIQHKLPEVVDYVIKDKISFIERGYTRHYIVDTNNIMIYIKVSSSEPYNGYMWKIANEGDVLRKTIIYDTDNVISNVLYQLISGGNK